jgi:hypothetical protein
MPADRSCQLVHLYLPNHALNLTLSSSSTEFPVLVRPGSFKQKPDFQQTQGDRVDLPSVDARPDDHRVYFVFLKQLCNSGSWRELLSTMMAHSARRFQLQAGGLRLSRGEDSFQTVFVTAAESRLHRLNFQPFDRLYGHVAGRPATAENRGHWR